MTGFTYRRGALLATLCAGPVYVLPIIFLILPQADTVADTVGLVFMIAISIPLGVMGAFLPISFGGYVMAVWGSRNPRARCPALWGMAGAAVAALIAAILYGEDRDMRFLVAIIGMFAITGAICALLIRFGTRWDDEAPANVINAHEGEVK